MTLIVNATNSVWFWVRALRLDSCLHIHCKYIGEAWIAQQYFNMSLVSARLCLVCSEIQQNYWTVIINISLVNVGLLTGAVIFGGSGNFIHCWPIFILQTLKENADGVIFCFSMTDRSSFEDIPQQMSKILADQTTNLSKLVVATK